VLRPPLKAQDASRIVFLDMKRVTSGRPPVISEDELANVDPALLTSHGYLKDDFDLVPYIQGLDELMEQQYAVFTTKSENPNIVFHRKQ
jgi:hypothetical protein